MQELFKLSTPKKVHVKVSSKSMRALFADCSIEYIRKNCRGICCFNSKGVLNVAIAPREEKYLKSLGVTIQDGLLQPKRGERRCPFQNHDGLCKIYKRKPIGCTISPFNLTANNTVIIRYRNLCMNCHKQGITPAYRVFRKSLDIMFGKKEARRICAHLDNDGGDLEANMFGDIYEDLMHNQATRKRNCE